MAELESDEPCGRGEYLELMGKIVWPSSMTRPDISHAVNKLCTKVSNPMKRYRDYGLDVVGYLSAHRNLGITYGGRIQIPMGLTEHPNNFRESSGLYVVHDSSFGTEARPMGGHVVMYCNGAVDWSASNLKIVPNSSHESESAEASRAAKSGIYARQLLLT